MCNSTPYSRFKTRVVLIGELSMGGDYPVRVQSMTNTDTLNTKATVEQAIRMIVAGCEYVRIACNVCSDGYGRRSVRDDADRNPAHGSEMG